MKKRHVTLTRPQREAVSNLWKRFSKFQGNGANYREFRKTVGRCTSRIGPVGVWVNGFLGEMYIGIETDGHTHF